MYFLRIQGRVTGPFTLEKLKALRARGVFQPFHEISTDKASWASASTLEEVFFPGSAPPALAAAPVEASIPTTQPWFYLDSAKEQVGPVEDTVFPSLVSQGLVNKRTLVWSPGMPGWVGVEDAMPHLFRKGAVLASAGHYQEAATPADPYAPPGVRIEKKNRIVAILLAWFLGCLGVHQFYLGNTGKGVLYLVLSFLCLPLPIVIILCLVDIILIATSKDPVYE